MRKQLKCKLFAMNIFNIIIRDEEITGIGPLIWQERGEGPVWVNYEFDLFTKVGIKTIKSQAFETFGHIERKDQEILKAFRIDYWATRKQIAGLIGERDEQSNSVLDELKQSYERLRIDYLALLTDLQPVMTRSKSKNILEGRLMSLEASICNLQTLATA
jgi:hypothetical protein